MAQRFGGRYSPQGNTPPETPRSAPRAPARVDPVGARSNILFVPPVILAFTSLTAGATGLAIGLGGAALLLLGAWFLREGLRAEAAFAARSVARAPAIPRKAFAAVLCGAGTATAAYANDPGIVASAIYGIAATALHVGAFGLDPMRSKGMDGAGRAQSDRVARVVDEAERYLSDMADAGRSTRDRVVEGRIDQFARTVRAMIEMVEQDPRDLTPARRYLGVYLMGARDAAQKFAALYTRTGDAAARDGFLALLSDLETGFGQKTQKLLGDDAADLEIEISVLRDRLGREGVRAAPDRND